MLKVRQVLRAYAAGNGTRTISNMLELSRTTVVKYVSIFNLSGMELDDVLNLPDNELYTMFKEDPRKAHGPEDIRYDELDTPSVRQLPTN